MKTITFYSYKGGVGRSLALSNIARRLSELNKKVCIIDFDLDAPGLQFKFNKDYSLPNFTKGIVDYIYDYSVEGKITDSILPFKYTLSPYNRNFADIDLIPAGNIYDNQYWKKLSMISWSDMFYAEESNGIQFFLDLKHKIETEIKPDFLLIDSRTGITDISGITLRLFANEVVILAVNNEENIFGSKMIIKNLLNKDAALFGKIPKINFVLTRLPYTDSLEDKSKKQSILSELTTSFEAEVGLEDFMINVIHTDRRLEEKERQLIGYSLEEKGVSISNDYLKLFQLLTSDLLTEDELIKFENSKKAENEYVKSLGSSDNLIRLKHIKKALELNPNNPSYIMLSSEINYSLGDYEKALSQQLSLLKIESKNDKFGATVRNNLAIMYDASGKFEEALKYVDEQIKLNSGALSLESYKTKCNILRKKGFLDEAKLIYDLILDVFKIIDPNILNSRADYYRTIDAFPNAYLDIYKALEINFDQGVFWATLAEINEAEGKMKEFYLNLRTALEKGMKLEELESTKNIYLKYQNDEKFIDLFVKYGIDFEMIQAL
jgi:MinD-like ATPase involved in chromosome partitioning or flagellar assembly